MCALEQILDLAIFIEKHGDIRKYETVNGSFPKSLKTTSGIHVVLQR